MAKKLSKKELSKRNRNFIMCIVLDVIEEHMDYYLGHEREDVEQHLLQELEDYGY